MSRLVQELSRNAPRGQVVRYLIVGAWNTLFAYGLFALLTYLLIPRIPSPTAAAMTASALGTVVCITVSFVCHKLFVFRTRGNFLKEYLRAFVVYGGTSLVGFLLLPIVMAVLNLFVTPQAAVPYLAGAILTAGTVVVSFFGHKRYTFAQNPSPPIDPLAQREG
ncbi:MAG: GtrA family protein [Thermoguttaceae bacterium]